MDRARWDAHVRARVFSGRPERAPFLSSTDCVRPRGFACPWLWEGAAVRECSSPAVTLHLTWFCLRPFSVPLRRFSAFKQVFKKRLKDQRSKNTRLRIFFTPLL